METIVTRSYKKYSYNFVFGDVDISKMMDINPDLGIKGEVIKLVVIIPNWINTVTAVISMINEDGKEIFVTSSMVKNEEYDITLNSNECIILGQTNEKWKITLSGIPGGVGNSVGTVVLTAYVKE